jgi:CubicO group peptidase (beta-lactamase class C family)
MSKASSIDVEPLRAAAQEEIGDDLVACQVAIGLDGDLLWFESFGRATNDTRFRIASCTKVFVASACWHLIADGSLDLAQPVAHYIPEFATHGKDVVTVEQVFLMTAGFPSAEMGIDEGVDAERRAARFAAWELEYEPGTQYAYHAASAHWVLADLLERLDGTDYRDDVEAQVTAPLGLPRVLGIPRADQDDIAGLRDGDTVALELWSATGTDPAMWIECGSPGGGGIATAGVLARFYQALLHDPGGLWDADVLADATSNIRTTLPDPLVGRPANRTIGLVVGAGFGSCWGRSPVAFGWPGAGGHVGFADPATGMSFGFVQYGDPDPLHAFERLRGIADLALVAAAGA